MPRRDYTTDDKILPTAPKQKPFPRLIIFPTPTICITCILREAAAVFREFLARRLKNGASRNGAAAPTPTPAAVGFGLLLGLEELMELGDLSLGLGELLAQLVLSSRTEGRASLNREGGHQGQRESHHGDGACTTKRGTHQRKYPP